MGRHFWLVQGGNSWEIEVQHAVSPHPYSASEWALDIGFMEPLKPGNYPSTAEDAVLYPQKLEAQLVRRGEHSYGLRIFLFDSTWQEIANAKARNLLPD